MRKLIITLLTLNCFQVYAWDQFSALDGNSNASASGGAISTEEATPSSGSCPEARKNWKRVTKDSENLTKYFKLAETKINAGGKTNVEIWAVGCQDGAQTFDASDADIKGDSAFPDNIVIPVKANTEIVDVSGIKSEADLNDGMMKFINTAKKKIKEGYVIDGSKEIVVYATATAVAPSCGAETGYDKQIAKSFDNTAQISNTELAYKRALNAAKLIKKLLIDPTVNDSNKTTTIKIKTHCSINTGSVPSLKVFGMLKKGEHVEKMNKVYNCGDDIAINGGVGNRPVPAWSDDRFTEFSVKESGDTPVLSLMVPGSDVVGGWVTKLNDHEWRSCYDTIYVKDARGDMVYSKKSYTFKNKRVANTMDECRAGACEQYFKAVKDSSTWGIPEMIYCSQVSSLGARTQTKPGDFQVTADDTKNYTIAWNPMNFKKGQRIRLNFDAVYVPDRFVVTVDDKRVIDTGYVSCVIDTSNTYHTGLPSLTPPQSMAIRGNYYANSNPISNCPSLPSGVTGTENGIDYIFPVDKTNAKIKLHVFGPYGTTIWRAKISCPDKDKAEPSIISDIKKKYTIN